MTEIVKFEAWHAAAIDLQPNQAWLHGTMTRETLADLEAGDSWSLMRGRTPILCAGVYPNGTQGYWAWALLAADLRRDMVGATRAIMRFLAGKGFCWTYISLGWTHGEAFGAYLGFRPIDDLAPEIAPDGLPCRVWGGKF